jgi:hypothetical protein
VNMSENAQIVYFLDPEAEIDKLFNLKWWQFIVFFIM